ncbi:MAG: ligase-associated DNA damage response exonuclease [Gemmobacter sp.]
MSRDPVLTLTDRGLYCPAGDFFIDPWRPVPRAVITHAHSDHARPGHGRHVATPGTLAVLRQRLGPVEAAALPYGEVLTVGNARVSLHPAGHVPGSAQVRVEVGGEVWVVSGDYKTETDGLSEPFVALRCHTFISECTFGLPVFRWRPQAEIAAEIRAWWAGHAAAGRFALIGAYALGKAQRLIAMLGAGGPGPILTHGAVEETCRTLRAAGYPIPPTLRVTPDTDLAACAGALVVAPPGALGTPWARRFRDGAHAAASGWMALRGVRRRRALGTGFVISDHADWPGLAEAIAATGAERVLVTHGYTAAFARWLGEQGLDAGVLATEFGGEDADDGAVG